MRSTLTARVHQVAHGFWRLLVGCVILMSVASNFAYTTAGFDFEVETTTGVEVIYYRIRWDDGATWVGRAIQGVARPNHALDWFDPGGTLLARSVRPGYSHWWNRFGFWWITTARDDPYVAIRYPGARVSAWVAVPSWLVLSIVAAPWLIRAGRRRFGSSGPIVGPWLE